MRSGTCSGTTTISSVADATALANCGTVKGTIVVADGVPENLKLDGLKNIQTLTVQGISGLRSLALPVISTIDKLVLEDLPNFEILKLAPSNPDRPTVKGYQYINVPKFASYPVDTAESDGGAVVFQDTAIKYINIHDESDRLENLIVTGNSDLQGLYVKVKDIDNNFTVTDNEKLRKYWSFQKLETVGGVLEVRGTFSE